MEEAFRLNIVPGEIVIFNYLQLGFIHVTVRLDHAENDDVFSKRGPRIVRVACQCIEFIHFLSLVHEHSFNTAPVLFKNLPVYLLLGEPHEVLNTHFITLQISLTFGDTALHEERLAATKGPLTCRGERRLGLVDSSGFPEVVDIMAHWVVSDEPRMHVRPT